jgi:coproporphyrinogen III oxidase-like Fe-S oxidoreductase
MIFSLRKNSGLDKNQFYNQFTKNLEDHISSKFDDFLDLQILEMNKDIYKFTDKGKLLSNEVFREILYPEG